MKLSTIITNTQHKELSFIKWKTPSTRRVQLNTYGARDKRGNAGCEGIIRGNEGEWLGGFIKHIGVYDAYIAEL